MNAGGLRAEYYKDAAGEWRWRVVAGNNEVIADSGEGYGNYSDAQYAFELLQRNIASVQPEIKTQESGE